MTTGNTLHCTHKDGTPIRVHVHPIAYTQDITDTINAAVEAARFFTSGEVDKLPEGAALEYLRGLFT